MEKTVTLAYLPGFGFDFVLHELIGGPQSNLGRNEILRALKVSNEVA